jgi:putative ABC transport system permease protein
MRRTIKLAFRSLLARPARTALTTFGIVLGVAVILAINITNQSTLDSISGVFSEASGKAQLIVESSNVNGAGFADSALREVAQAPGVQTAVPSVQVSTVLADDMPDQHGASILGATGGNLTLYGIDPMNDPATREYKIVEGRFLALNVESQEIVLVKDFADKKKLKVGRDIEILTPNGPEVVRLVGLMSKDGPGRLNNGAFGIIPLKAAQQLFDRMGDLDQIDIVATPQMSGSKQIDQLKDALQAQLGEQYTVTYPAAQGKRVTQMLDTYAMGLNFFSAIAIFVGAFLIYNAFSMTVAERTHEIGMLRTIGMTKRQVMAQILAEAVMLGIAGCVLGILFGIVLSFALTRGMEMLVKQDLEVARVPLSGLIVSAAVGMVVTILAATLPAFQAGRTSPLEALRSRGAQNDGWLIRNGLWLGSLMVILSLIDMYFSPLPQVIQSKISYGVTSVLFMGASFIIPASVGLWERVSRPLIRLIYGGEGRLGSQNIQRAKMRTTLTVSALMVGAAMILGIRGLTQAFQHDIKNWTDQYIGGDLFIYSSLRMPMDLGRRLEAIDSVQAVAASRSFQITWTKPDGGKERLTFRAVDPEAYRRVTSFVFADSQGDPNKLTDELAQGDTVFLTTTLSEKYHIGQGDTITLNTRRGPHQFRVAAIVIDFSEQGLVVQGSWKDMNQYFGLKDVDVFYLKVQPGQVPADVQKTIDYMYGKRRHLTIQSNSDVKAQALATMSQAFAMFDVLAMISMVVAAFGVINTLSMNVMERTRELGMLRGVGMTGWQVSKMILAESSMMGLIGAAFGLALGLVMTRVMLIASGSMMGYHVKYILPTQGIWISVAIALFVSQVAAIGPARRAAHLRIIEAIQFE